jgi:protein-S-isoprenylcysteine O-methyltransferase Ste14
MLYLKDGINPFVLGKGKSFFNKFIVLLFFAGLLIWSYEILATSLNLNFHIISVEIIHNITVVKEILYIIGMILILVGFTIFLLSIIAFGKSWRVGIDKEKPGKLISHGVFSITRNPIFIYIDFYFIGTALIYTTPFFIITSMVVIIGIHYQIIQEEKFLMNYYGEEYLAYKNRVRRYL